jgi:hypothetical protein
MVSTLISPYQPHLRRDRTPMEQIESTAVMLAIAIKELPKREA